MIELGRLPKNPRSCITITIANRTQHITTKKIDVQVFRTIGKYITSTQQCIVSLLHSSAKNSAAFCFVLLCFVLVVILVWSDSSSISQVGLNRHFIVTWGQRRVS